MRRPVRSLGLAYTGCRTSALFDTLSKVGNKLRLAHAGLPTPKWSADGRGLNRDARVLIKATWEHGSLGLDETSVVRCADARRVIAARTMRLNTEHFAEAYIEGREFHLALLEQISGVEVLPIAEILFGDLEPHAPKIFGYDAKWTPSSPAYIGTLRRFGLERNEPNLPRRLSGLHWLAGNYSGSAAMRASIFVSISNCAPFIIDVNPNPYLTPDTEDAAAAAEAGLSYQDLIGNIVESSLGVSQVVPPATFRKIA